MPLIFAVLDLRRRVAVFAARVTSKNTHRRIGRAKHIREVLFIRGLKEGHIIPRHSAPNLGDASRRPQAEKRLLRRLTAKQGQTHIFHPHLCFKVILGKLMGHQISLFNPHLVFPR